MPNLASLESVVSLGVKAHTFAVFRVGVACEARSNDARDAKRMAQGRVGGAEGVRKRPCTKQTVQGCAGNAWVA